MFSTCKRLHPCGIGDKSSMTHTHINLAQPASLHGSRMDISPQQYCVHVYYAVSSIRLQHSSPTTSGEGDGHNSTGWVYSLLSMLTAMRIDLPLCCMHIVSPWGNVHDYVPSRTLSDMYIVGYNTYTII